MSSRQRKSQADDADAEYMAIDVGGAEDKRFWDVDCGRVENKNQDAIGDKDQERKGIGMGTP